MTSSVLALVLAALGVLAFLLRDLHAGLLWLGCTPAFMSDFSGAFEMWSTFSFGFDMELSSLAYGCPG
jgi:hypothetical protein